MKVLFFSFILIFTQGLWASPVEIQGDISLPEGYIEMKNKMDKEDKIIPEKAQNASSAQSFATTVLDFHLQNFLKKNPNSSLSKLKSFEKSLNEGTAVETESIKIKPKVDLAQMNAEVDIESFIHSRLKMENQFRTFHAEVDLYKIQEGQLGLEYKSDSVESRALIGYKKVW